MRNLREYETTAEFTVDNTRQYPTVSRTDDNGHVKFEERKYIRLSITTTTANETVRVIGEECTVMPIEVLLDRERATLSGKTIRVAKPGRHTVRVRFEDMTRIPNDAFRAITILTAVAIPDSVMVMGKRAFYDCFNLASVSLGETVRSIGDYAFESCRSLISVDIPDSVTVLGGSSFAYCYLLETVSLSKNITTINNATFSNCNKLSSLAIPPNVTTIRDDAFLGCQAMSSFVLPKTVTSVGTSVFGGCSSLQSLSVESGNTVYDSRDNCNAIIETATNKLMTACLNTVIPNTVTEIGKKAFASYDTLTRVTIPSSVTSLGSECFAHCDMLENIIINARTAPTISASTFQNISNGGTLYYPNGSDYSSFMQNGEFYLGFYGWTAVGQ